MDEFIGCIKMFGFNFNPRGWALCQGQLLSIAQNTALFSLLGTTYGGNGQTTFGLPDFRGRAAIGQGQGPGLNNYVMGQMAGVEAMTLTQNNLPPHTHTATAVSTSTTTGNIVAENATADAQNPANKFLGSGTSIYANPDATQNRAMAAGTINATTTTDTTVTVNVAGAGQAFDLRTPYLCVNYSICLEGIFPSRN